MDVDPALKQQCDAAAVWFEHTRIPHAERMIQKLRDNPTDGHLWHATVARQLYEDGTYTITDLEASSGAHDVDIQLNNAINIQVWYGQNVHGHVIEKQFTESGRAHNAKNNYVTRLGGTHTDWDKDREAMFKKLSQLPDDKLGIVLLSAKFIDFHALPEWCDDVPNNKCVVNTMRSLVAVPCCSRDFQRKHEVRKIAGILGYEVAPF